MGNNPLFFAFMFTCLEKQKTVFMIYHFNNHIFVSHKYV